MICTDIIAFAKIKSQFNELFADVYMTSLTSKCYRTIAILKILLEDVTTSFSLTDFFA